MKKWNIIAICLTIFTLLSSCDKFLDLTPSGQKVVNSVEDYRDLLSSYMRLLKTPNRDQSIILGTGPFTFPAFDVSSCLGVYTGETTLSLKGAYYDKNNNEYTMAGMQLLTWKETNVSERIWNQYYEFLGCINLIINGIEKAEGKDEDLRRRVRGEALVWRAYSYFKLLQYYSPYKNDHYGIPVYLTPEEDIGTIMPNRKSQTEVFQQIIGDCTKVLEYLESTPYSEWNCAYRYDFVNAMLASIYLWKAQSGASEPEDWQKAEKAASEAMLGRSLTNSPTILTKMFDCSNVSIETDMTSDEFYFRIMDGDNYQIFNFVSSYYESGYMVSGEANPDYYNKFKDNDIRKAVYFTEDGSKSDKYKLLQKWTGYGCLAPFRLAEMYLIKAEALLRQGKVSEASQVLNIFQSSRYIGSINTPTTEEELLKEILDERLREFYMENDFRWMDMKRQGVSLTRVIQGEKYTLDSNDFRYCLPIPLKEIETNKNMVQTPGWDKVILN